MNGKAAEKPPGIPNGHTRSNVPEQIDRDPDLAFLQERQRIRVMCTMKRLFPIGLLLFGTVLMAQRSPFTGTSVVPPDSTGSYRLIFGAHFHGASNSRSGYPAATVLANIDTINGLAANALFSAGDLFLDAGADIQRFERSLFTKLTVPLFNAPGNHDVESPRYAERYGPTFGVVPMGADRMIWLDTERDLGSIVGDQLDLLRSELERFDGKNLFIVAHRPLWAEGDSPYSELFAGNTRSLVPGNYRNTILPMLEEVAKRARVYWISGSMAGLAPSSIFFQEHIPNLTYIQCAVRDVPRDAILVADVTADTVIWTGISLTGRSMLQVQDYDAAWWSRSIRKKEPFNVRLVPLYVRQTVFSSTFWYGVLSALSFMLLLRAALRRWL
jgi:hypothetical protein